MQNLGLINIFLELWAQLFRENLSPVSQKVRENTNQCRCSDSNPNLVTFQILYYVVGLESQGIIYSRIIFECFVVMIFWFCNCRHEHRILQAFSILLILAEFVRLQNYKLSTLSFLSRFLTTVPSANSDTILFVVAPTLTSIFF